jgi:hypothetical protein
MATFTKRQLDVAIRVLMETDLVKRWAEGELRAYGIGKDTPEGKNFLLKERRKQAEKIISSAK